MGGEQLWGSGVSVAPFEVGVESAGEHDVVGVVRVVQHELSERPEVGFDRVRPRAVGRCETQLDAVPVGPLADLVSFVR